jgi:hypothetical protein
MGDRAGSCHFSVNCEEILGMIKWSKNHICIFFNINFVFRIFLNFLNCFGFFEFLSPANHFSSSPGITFIPGA